MKLPSRRLFIGYILPSLVIAALWIADIAIDHPAIGAVWLWGNGVCGGWIAATMRFDALLNRAWNKLRAVSDAELEKGHGYNSLMLASRCFAVGQVLLGRDPTELPICPDPECELCERDEPMGELQ